MKCWNVDFCGAKCEQGDTSSATDGDRRSQNLLGFLTQPLRISSGICASGSLLLVFTALSTSYWVTESTSQGLAHGGLWEICLDPECRFYWFRVLAYVHITRAGMTVAALCGIVTLTCICISFEHSHVGPVPLVPFAAAFSFVSGLIILISMSVFTAVYRTTKPYIQHLVIFGSSYGLGWASIPMYFITGGMLVLTHRTTIV